MPGHASGGWYLARGWEKAEKPDKSGHFGTFERGRMGYSVLFVR